jgi:hypothetical protein
VNDPVNHQPGGAPGGSTGELDDERMTARLVAVAVLGALLFAPPLLSLFDRDTRVAGVPLLYAYLFAAWALIIVVIGLVAAVARRPD